MIQIYDRCNQRDEIRYRLGGLDEGGKLRQKYNICAKCTDEFILYRDMFESNFVEDYKEYNKD